MRAQQQTGGTVGNAGIGFGLGGLQLVTDERHGTLHNRLRVHIGGDVRQCGKRRVNAAEEISGGVHRVHHTGQLVDDRSVASRFWVTSSEVPGRILRSLLGLRGLPARIPPTGFAARLRR